MTASIPHRIRWRFVLVLLACLVVSLICVAYPIYVIRPFRTQGANELAAALVVARFQRLMTVISAGVALLAMFGYWREKP